MVGVVEMLKELYALPEGLLDLPAAELHGLLGGPTLIHLQGSREPALLVSVLMHGNEDVGWEAMRGLLRKYLPGGGELALPRSLSLFICNTAAAENGLRQLEGQPDYNRVWPGTDQPDSAERAMMEQVVDTMVKRGVFASIDVHNNTGMNPHYACINAIRTESLHLAAMFSRTVVYFLCPKGVQSMAMTAHCPAVTLECGKAGQAHGVQHAMEYLDACLHLMEHPEHPIAHHDVDLFHTVAIVKVPKEVDFGFGCDDGELCLVDDLDRLNFRELPVGTGFGRIRKGADIPLVVRNEHDQDVSRHYFAVEDGELKTSCVLMPSMLTRDETVIRQDCLGYLMERYDRHLVEAE